MTTSGSSIFKSSVVWISWVMRSVRSSTVACCENLVGPDWFRILSELRLNLLMILKAEVTCFFSFSSSFSRSLSV